jgi:hypothetical protein
MNQPFTLNQNLLDKLYERYTGSLDSMDFHASDSSESEAPHAPLAPSQFQQFIETVYWASLQQEEARFHNFTMLLMSREKVRRQYGHYVFNKPVPFNVTNVAKLAPALDPQANFVGVWVDEDGQLVMWGFVPTDDTGLTAATLDPGQLLISFKEIGMENFTLLLSGTRGEFVRRSEFLSWLLPESKTERWMEVRRKHQAEVMRAADYRDITTFMRSHRHGGTLLVVKADGDWGSSLATPTTFAAGEAYDKVNVDILTRNQTMDQEREREVIYTESPRFRLAIDSGRKSLETIGRLTAVDGAAVMTYDLDVLAFGAKIRPKGERKPQSVLLLEPFEESAPREISLATLGGMRHQSAAQFVFDQPEALAFVSSQDGRLSVMRWDAEKNIVTVIRPAEFALL